MIIPKELDPFTNLPMVTSSMTSIPALSTNGSTLQKTTPPSIPTTPHHSPPPPPDPTRKILGLDAEFVNVTDGRLNRHGNRSGKSRVDHLAIVTVDDDADGSYTILHNKVIIPRIQDGQEVRLETHRSGITEGDHHNGIPYEEAILEVKEILKDAIVVGHTISVTSRRCSC